MKTVHGSLKKMSIVHLLQLLKHPFIILFATSVLHYYIKTTLFEFQSSEGTSLEPFDVIWFMILIFSERIQCLCSQSLLVVMKSFDERVWWIAFIGILMFWVRHDGRVYLQMELLGVG